MPAEIWVGQFSIVAGETREEGPWTALFPPRPGRGVHLYVLVEPTSASGGEVCQPLAAAIGRLFQQQRLSLTGGLLAALRGAHQQLRDWNQRSLREHRVGAGATCLALRGSEAHLAAAVGEGVLAGLLSLPPRDVLPELYLRARHLNDFAALLVAFLPSEES